MKKLIALLAVLLLCAAVAIPAVATDNFVGSPNKGSGVVITPGSGGSSASITGPSESVAPEVLPEGYDSLEQLLQSETFLSIENCIVVTSVTEAEEKTTDISQEARDLLIEIYDGMVNGNETLPIEGDFSVRDLVDVSFKYDGCELLEDHGNKAKILALPGVTLSINFQLGVGADEKLVVMTYDKESKTWTDIESVTNNGDGTVTCVFEDICPVAFAVLG